MCALFLLLPSNLSTSIIPPAQLLSVPNKSPRDCIVHPNASILLEPSNRSSPRPTYIHIVSSSHWYFCSSRQVPAVSSSFPLSTNTARIALLFNLRQCPHQASWQQKHSPPPRPSLVTCFTLYVHYYESDYSPNSLLGPELFS